MLYLLPLLSHQSKTPKQHSFIHSFIHQSLERDKEQEIQSLSCFGFEEELSKTHSYHSWSVVCEYPTTNRNHRSDWRRSLRSSQLVLFVLRGSQSSAARTATTTRSRRRSRDGALSLKEVERISVFKRKELIDRRRCFFSFKHMCYVRHCSFFFSFFNLRRQRDSFRQPKENQEKGLSETFDRRKGCKPRRKHASPRHVQAELAIAGHS